MKRSLDAPHMAAQIGSPVGIVFSELLSAERALDAFNG
jgi:hypothetical protein